MLKLIKESPCSALAIIGALLIGAGILWQIPWGPSALCWIGVIIVFIAGCAAGGKHMP